MQTGGEEHPLDSSLLLPQLHQLVQYQACPRCIPTTAAAQHWLGHVGVVPCSNLLRIRKRKLKKDIADRTDVQIFEERELLMGIELSVAKTTWFAMKIVDSLSFIILICLC